LIRVLEEADAVMDIWGIAFADSLGSNSFLIRLTDVCTFGWPNDSASRDKVYR
jgi:hypothetical protein